MTIARCFSPARFTPPTRIHGRYVPPDIQLLHTTTFKALRPQKKTFREEQALAAAMGAISVDATNLPQMRFSLLKLQRIVPETERY
jgi:hypothetical protein